MALEKNPENVRACMEAMRYLLMRVHRNLGHPPNATLTGLLRDARAPAEVVEASKELTCEACELMNRPKARMPAAAHDATLGEILATDGFLWQHPVTHRWARLQLFIDEYRRLIKVVVLQDSEKRPGNTST